MVDQVIAPAFSGFTPPQENWSKLPNALIESLPIFSSMAEIKVVMYVLRHTWGYAEFGQPKTITLDEFMHGRKRKDGTRLDPGTGLAKSNIIKGINKAIEHGFLAVGKDDKDVARKRRSYRIRMCPESQSDVSNQDIRGIESIHRTEKDTFGKKPISLTPPASQAENPIPKPESPSMPLKEKNLDKNLLAALRTPTPIRVVSQKLPPPPKAKIQPSPTNLPHTGKKARKPKPTDALWNAIADEFFQGARVGNQRLGRILYGSKDNGLFGIIAFEAERQDCPPDGLDYALLADLVSKFHESLPDDTSKLKVNGRTPKIELRDPAKFIERWIGWRETKPVQANHKPELDYDPNCSLGCDKGTIYHTDEKGYVSSEYCICRVKILEARKGRRL